MNMRAEAEGVASCLLGTTRSIAAVCHEEGIDLDLFWEYGYDYLCELVFQCDGCGFWFSTDELNNVSGDCFCGDCLYLEVHQD